MGFFDKILHLSDTIARGYTKAPAVPSSTKYPDWALRNAEVEQWQMPGYDKADAQGKLYLYLSWVRMAISNLYNVCLAAELSIFERGQGGADDKDIVNHPLEVLLSKPNPLQSKSELMEATISSFKLTGNSYWWLNITGGVPTELWHIPTNHLTPLPDGKMFILGYQYDPGDGQFMVIPPERIIHFKEYNPDSMFIGSSPVQTLGIVANQDLKTQEWMARLYGENNGRMPGILKFSQMYDDDTWASIKKETISSSKFRNILALRGTGDGSIDYIPVAQSLVDMELLTGRTFTKEEVFGLLAPGLASILAVNATEANAKTGKATLIEFAAYPMLVKIAEKITNDLLPVFGENLIAKFDDIRPADRVLKLQETVEYAKYHTLAEIRKEMYGDGPIGDERDIQIPAMPTPAPMASADFMQAQPPAQDEEQELKAWAKYAQKGHKREFRTEHINSALAGAIEGALKICKTQDEIKAVFESVWRGYP